MTTVFAVDDHDAFLATVAMVIESMDGFELVGSARSAEEALVVEGAASPRSASGRLIDDVDVMMIDYRLPGISGLELARVVSETVDDGRDRIRPLIVLMSSYGLDMMPTDTVQWRFVDEFVAKAHLSPDVLQSCWSKHIEREVAKRDDTRW